MDWKVFGCIDSSKGVDVVQLTCAPVVFHNIVYSLLLFAGIGALIFIIYGGFKYLTSWGDPKQVDEGKKAIMFAIMGLMVVLFSFFILSFIGSFTGANCINKFGFVSCT